MASRSSPAISRPATKKKPFDALLVGVLVLLGLLIVILPASYNGDTHWIIDESGPVEEATVGLYGVAIALFVYRGGLRLPAMRGYAIVTVLAFLLAREFDMHKRFTTMGVFKIDYYRSAAVDWHEAAVVIAVLMVIAAALIRLAWDLDRFWWGIKVRDTSMTAVALSACAGAVSKIFDGASDKLRHLGYTVTPETAQNLTKVEEVLELGIPAFAIVAILSYPGPARITGD